MERNTVQKGNKDRNRHIDTRTEEKGVGKLGWFMSDINHKIPTKRVGK